MGGKGKIMKSCPYCGKSIHSDEDGWECAYCGANSEDDKFGRIPSYLKNGKGLCIATPKTTKVTFPRAALFMLRLDQ